MWSGVKLVLSGRELSCSRHFLTVLTASLVGMRVKSEVTLYDTIVLSESSVISLILLVKSWEFLTWCGVLPTRGAMIIAWCLDMLYVTELMPLMMGLSSAPNKLLTLSRSHSWERKSTQLPWLVTSCSAPNSPQFIYNPPLCPSFSNTTSYFQPSLVLTQNQINTGSTAGYHIRSNVCNSRNYFLLPGPHISVTITNQSSNRFKRWMILAWYQFVSLHLLRYIWR